jgi:hypothetical protein
MSYCIHSTPAGPTLSVLSEKGTEVFIHSRVNPAQERSLSVPELRPGTTVIILGLGLGYHLRELFSRYPDIRCIIIEHEKGLVAETAKVQGSSFLQPQTTIIEGCGTAELESRIGDIGTDLMTGSLLILEHPASVRSFPRYYTAAQDLLKRLINRRASDEGTIARFGLRFLKNALHSLLRADSSISAAAFDNAFSGYSALLVASGPGLDQLIPFIRQHQRSVFIIAVDSTNDALLSAGITPDFVFSVDPQAYTREHLEYAHSGAVLIHSLTAYPHYGFSPSALFFNSHPVCQALTQLGCSIPVIDSATGNVLGDAALFARRCGFATIYLAGLDSCFPDGMAYARHTSYTRRFVRLSNRFTTGETRHADYIFRSSRACVHQGRFTRRAFLRYKEGFESLVRDNAQFIHINDIGLPMSGIHTITGEAWADTISHAPINKHAIMESLLRASSPVTLPRAALRELMRQRDVRDELISLSLGEKATESTLRKAARLLEALL